jgi:hypothetical protein
MSHVQLRDEKAHWAWWIQHNGLIAHEPQAQQVTRIQAWAATGLGVVIGLLGPVGFVSGFLGNLLTAAGFVATVWGLFVSARLRFERDAPAKAAERVANRLADLAARRRFLARGDRQE